LAGRSRLRRGRHACSRIKGNVGFERAMPMILSSAPSLWVQTARVPPISPRTDKPVRCKRAGEPHEPGARALRQRFQAGTGVSITDEHT
jgi:hypothetical protein